jgi:soluble lytic murein transglycosylase-like protein
MGPGGFLDFEFCLDLPEAPAVRRLLLSCLMLLVAAGCAPERGRIDRGEVWAAIQPHATRYRLDPAFIYALVAAESSFDARARNGEACGLLQLKPAAWATVAAEPYEPGVWDWQRNLAVGVDYLAWCRHALHTRRRYSDRLLLAAFHYGFDFVARHDFDERRIPQPDHPIYRRLWAGHWKPVAPPADNSAGTPAPPQPP